MASGVDEVLKGKQTCEKDNARVAKKLSKKAAQLLSVKVFRNSSIVKGEPPIRPKLSSRCVGTGTAKGKSKKAFGTPCQLFRSFPANILE